jgi:hypothetical protein
MANSKQSSAKTASLAAKTLQDPNASKIQKSLAASVISQSSTSKVTSAEMEAKASKALQSDHSAELTKTLAGSVLSQADKAR